MSEPDVEVRTYFARGRNALVARADFSELYAAWYLHCMDHGLDVPPSAAPFAKEALAAIVLHLAGRPWKESCAWTIGFPSPRLNIFVAGDNNNGTVIANLQTANPNPLEQGMFHAHAVEGSNPVRRSLVDFQADSIFEAASIFMARSDQRPTRFFQFDSEDHVMVSAQPDCDIDWLESLDDRAIRSLDSDVELSLLEKRKFDFKCGCTPLRILETIMPAFQKNPDELFGDSQSVTIPCPRCSARHVITRETADALRAGDPDRKN